MRVLLVSTIAPAKELLGNWILVKEKIECLDKPVLVSPIQKNRKRLAYSKRMVVDQLRPAGNAWPSPAGSAQLAQHCR